MFKTKIFKYSALGKAIVYAFNFYSVHITKGIVSMKFVQNEAGSALHELSANLLLLSCKNLYICNYSSGTISNRFF